MSRHVTQNGAVVTCAAPTCTCNSTPAPTSLEAIRDQVADLIIEWHEADRWADNCPRSERDDARGLAEERKDVVLQYLSHVVAATSPEHAHLRAEVERLTDKLDSRQRVFRKAMKLAQRWQSRAEAAEAELRAKHELMPYPTGDGPLAPENDDRVMCYCGDWSWDGNDPASETEFAAHVRVSSGELTTGEARDSERDAIADWLEMGADLDERSGQPAIGVSMMRAIAESLRENDHRKAPVVAPSDTEGGAS